MKKIIFIVFIFCFFIGQYHSQNNYYIGLEDLSGEELRTELCEIISSNYHSIGYNNRKDYFCEIDAIMGYYWDIYSDCRTNEFLICKPFVSSSNIECGGVNTEHTIPQYFFNQNEPMKSDLFHIYPVSAKLNGNRGNSPYGDAIAGLAGRWEPPLDEYKGDIARSYFYFATRYKNQINSWGNDFDMFSYNNLSSWAITMFLRWHEDDSVSQKEIDRNNKIYNIQNNRNPFIDCPCYANKIWNNNYNEECDCFSTMKSNIYDISSNIKINLFDNIIDIESYNFDIKNLIIYDITGKLILNENINNKNFNKNIEYIDNGIYIINIKSSNGIEYSEKIIKY